jgi:prophage endopeptidase
MNLLVPVWRYLLAACLGAVLGAGLAHLNGTRRLAQEQAARAEDARRHANELMTLNQAALTSEQRTITARDAAATRVAAVDAQLTQERMNHEADNRNYRAGLATGAERLRVAVSACSGVRDGMPDRGAAGAAGMGDDAAAYADLDRAVAERIFSVAGDDDAQIDKLKALQGYVCAIRADTPGCS